jgi:lysophospholipase L1-like esterase
MDKTGGNILNITGSSPYIDLPSSYAVSANTNSINTAIGAGVTNTANHTPALSMYNAVSASNLPMLVLRGNFQRLNVSNVGATDLAGTYGIWVSVDGAAPTKYNAIASVGNANAISITATAGTHTYYVWSTWSGAVFSAAGDSTATAMTGLPQLHQFGDSITSGITNDRGNIDTFRIGASIGYPALTLGVSGYTIEQLDTALSGWLTATPVTSSDVAVLAIGRNNVGGSFSAPVTTAYNSILNKLIAEGYGKILVRGILPTGNLSSTFPLENASIQSCIATVNNPKLIFVDTSTCPAYATESGDNTHPTSAGYVTIADYLLPKYRTALGI